MLKSKKQFILLGFALAALQPSFAQTQTVPVDTSGEIIITQAELESLLTTIALRKKKILDEERLNDLLLFQPKPAAVQTTAQPIARNQNAPIDQQWLRQELQNINNRINMLIQAQYGGAIMPSSNSAAQRNDPNSLLASTAPVQQRAQIADGTTYQVSPQSQIAGTVPTTTTYSNSQLSDTQREQAIASLKSQIAELSQSLNATQSRNTYQEQQVAALQDRINQLNALLAYNNRQPQTTQLLTPNYYPVNSNDRSSSRDIARLSNAISAMGALSAANTARQPNYVNSVRPVTGSQYYQIDTLYADSAVYSALEASKQKTSALQRTVDSLQRIVAGADDIALDSASNGQLQAMQTRINALQNELKAKSEAEKSEEEWLNTIRGFNQAIYFGNNQTAISDEGKRLLEDLATTVKQNDRVAIVLRGYASTVGSAAYNRTISAKRADEVKKVLLANGVKAQNIITKGQGSDNSKNEQEARRVEITLLIQ